MLTNETPLQDVISTFMEGLRKMWQRIKRTIREMYESLFQKKRAKIGFQSETWKNVRRQSLYKIQQDHKPKPMPVMNRLPGIRCIRSNC